MIIAQLPTPIPIFNKEITQVAWRLQYPENFMYYQMQTSEGLCLKEGNWTVPIEVIQSWGEDDSVVSDALITAAPWND
jgi:hypothetical protein